MIFIVFYYPDHFSFNFLNSSTPDFLRNINQTIKPIKAKAGTRTKYHAVLTEVISSFVDIVVVIEGVVVIDG